MHQSKQTFLGIIGHFNVETGRTPVAAQINAARVTLCESTRRTSEQQNKAESETDQSSSLRAASQLVTCMAMRPRLPSTTLSDTASPG